MTQPQDNTRETRYIGAHGVAQLLLWSGFYYLLPALSSQIAAETGWPILHISTTFTLSFFLWAITAPVVGILIDAGKGGKVMRIGAVIGIALLLGLSVTTDKMVFSVLVILLGACMAATLYDPCFAIMMRRLRPNGANAVATVTLIAGFATLLTFPLVIGLSSVMGWHQIVQVFAVVAAIGMVLLPAEAAAASPPRVHARLPFERGPVLIALSFGLVMMGHAMLLFLLPVALAQSHGTAHAAMLALAILGPAQIAGRLAWRYFGAGYAPQHFAVLMFACLCLPATLMLLTGAAPFGVYLALILQGMCYGVHTILRPSLAQRFLAPSHFGRGLGGIAMVGLLLMAIGPAIGGVVWTAAGLSGLLATILALNVVALLLGIVLRGMTPMEAVG